MATEEARNQVTGNIVLGDELGSVLGDELGSVVGDGLGSVVGD